MASRVLDWVAGLGDATLLIGAFLLAFGESALFLDLVVPGEAGMVVVGAAARDADLNLGWVILVATIGAVLGDSLGYWVGRRFGPGAVDRWQFTRRHLRPKLDRAQRTFEHRGGWAVVAARFVGVLRAVVPVIAGAAGMPYPRFLAWDVVGSLAWVTAVVSLGWFFGDAVASVVDRFGLVISAIVLGALVVWWLLHRRSALSAEPD